MKKQFLEAGKIVGTHGVRGEMKVEPWVDSPELLKSMKTLYFDEGATALAVLTSRVHKNLLLITVSGVNSATEADLLRGKLVYINRDEVKLPKNRYFIADLIGIK
ncbi:MAG: ribosome maturation factor RimM, partial [Oscillospiraceae bacterium]